MDFFHKKKTVFFFLFLIGFNFLFLNDLAWGVDGHEVVRFFNAEVGKIRPSYRYRFVFYPEESVQGQPTSIKKSNYNLSGIFPVWQNPHNDFSLRVGLQAEKFATQAILQTSGDLFPHQLFDIRFSPIYRHQFQNGWTAGGNFELISASDHPFSRWGDVEYVTNVFLRIPTQKNNAWVFLINHSNHREFLNHIPLPGGGYWWGSHKHVQGMFGIPFTLQFFPKNKVNFRASYFPILDVNAELGYDPTIFLRLYSSFAWSNQRYFRSERSNANDRLFYYEKRLAAGVKFRPTRWAELDLSGGYLFDRFFFEGDGYQDRFKNRFNVNAGPFTSLQIGFRL